MSDTYTYMSPQNQIRYMDHFSSLSHQVSKMEAFIDDHSDTIKQ